MNRRGIHGIGLVPPVMMGGNFDEAYLLRDDFSDTLPAGSVHGTLAVPGPGGARAVTDTNGKLSLSSGALSFATGSVVNDGVWYPLIVRTPGRILLASILPSDANCGVVAFGWSSANSDIIDERILLHASSVLQISGTSGAGITVGAYAITKYKVAAILRAAGVIWFIKGGAFTNWVFLGIIGALGTNAYPGIATKLTTLVCTSDFIRVPVTIWLPTPLASDGMSSATLTDGLGHAEGIAGGIGAGGANVPWATAATWAVAGGVALNTPVLGAEQNSGALVIGTWYSITATQVNYFYVGCAIGDSFRATATTGLDVNNKVKAFTTAELFRPLNTSFTVNVIAQVKAVAMTARTHSGLAIRLNDSTTPTSGILAYFDKGSITVDEFSGATYTQLFTAVKAFTANDSLQLIADGVNVRLFHMTSAGVATLIGSTAVATITTGGYHGLFSTDVGNTLDNLCIYPRGTGGEFNILNRWST